MFKAGVRDEAICTEVGLTDRQWEWLLRIGDPERGLPSFNSLCIEEARLLCTQSEQTAAEIGKTAVAIFRRKMSTANTASMILNRIVAQWAHEAGANPNLDALAQHAPDRQLLEAMRLLERLQNVGVIAEEYWRVYKPEFYSAMRSGAAGGTLALAERIRTRGGAATVNVQALEAFGAEWGSWTDQQREHFIATNEPPNPKDVIDVEAKQSA